MWSDSKRENSNAVCGVVCLVEASLEMHRLMIESKMYTHCQIYPKNQTLAAAVAFSFHMGSINGVFCVDTRESNVKANCEKKDRQTLDRPFTYAGVTF